MQPISTHAGAFAQNWPDAWNRHSLEDIVAHYQDGVISRSHDPRVTGAREGILRGKPALRACWGNVAETFIFGEA